MAVATAAIVLGALATTAAVGQGVQASRQARKDAREVRHDARNAAQVAQDGLRREGEVAKANALRDAMRLRRRVVSAYSSAGKLATSPAGAIGKAPTAFKTAIGG